MIGGSWEELGRWRLMPPALMIFLGRTAQRGVLAGLVHPGCCPCQQVRRNEGCVGVQAWVSMLAADGVKKGGLSFCGGLCLMAWALARGGGNC